MYNHTTCMFGPRPHTQYVRMKSLGKCRFRWIRGPRHISYTYGRFGDPYQTIKSQPEEVTNKLAKSLESCAQGQRALRMDLLGKLHGTVLDVGTGTGAVARELGKLSDIERVIGIDPSPAFLSRAKSYGGPKEQYVEAYAKSLTHVVQSSSVDHALIWMTLMHIPEEDHLATFSEMMRVLKPGGTLHLFDNDPCAWDFRLRAHDPLASPVHVWLDRNLPDRFLIRRAPTILRSAGFDVATLRILTSVHTTLDSYGYQNILIRAIDEFALTNVVGPPMVDAMKVEAARRVKSGEFQMTLSYGYVSATKPSIPD